MSKASLLEDDLAARRLSPVELQERREAARPRTNMIATTHGTFEELLPVPIPAKAPTPAPTPTPTPKIIFTAPEDTSD